MTALSTARLEQIIAHGNKPSMAKARAEVNRKGKVRYAENWIRCYDGFKVSVIAGPGTYCSPRPPLIPELGPALGADADPEYPGPYTEVEIGFPSERPEPWDTWAQYCEDPSEPTKTVYAYVPVDLVRLLIAAHGGEA